MNPRALLIPLLFLLTNCVKVTRVASDYNGSGEPKQLKSSFGAQQEQKYALPVSYDDAVTRLRGWLGRDLLSATPATGEKPDGVLYYRSWLNNEPEILVIAEALLGCMEITQGDPDNPDLYGACRDKFMQGAMALATLQSAQANDFGANPNFSLWGTVVGVVNNASAWATWQGAGYACGSYTPACNGDNSLTAWAQAAFLSYLAEAMTVTKDPGQIAILTSAIRTGVAAFFPVVKVDLDTRNGSLPAQYQQSSTLSQIKQYEAGLGVPVVHTDMYSVGAAGKTPAGDPIIAFNYHPLIYQSPVTGFPVGDPPDLAIGVNSLVFKALEIAGHVLPYDTVPVMDASGEIVSRSYHDVATNGMDGVYQQLAYTPSNFTYAYKNTLYYHQMYVVSNRTKLVDGHTPAALIETMQYAEITRNRYILAGIPAATKVYLERIQHDDLAAAELRKPSYVQPECEYEMRQDPDLSQVCANALAQVIRTEETYVSPYAIFEIFNVPLQLPALP